MGPGKDFRAGKEEIGLGGFMQKTGENCKASIWYDSTNVTTE